MGTVMKESMAIKLARMSVPEPNSGCVLWIGCVNAKGYGAVAVNRIKTPAHRVAYELACGPIPEGMHVCHRCDVPACINPAHLFLGFGADNIADKINKGRQARGRMFHRSAISDADVIAIRAAYDTRTRKHWGGRRFAVALGISDQAVDAIAKGETWKHVPMPKDHAP